MNALLAATSNSDCRCRSDPRFVALQISFEDAVTKAEHELTHALRQSLLKIQELKQTLRAAESVSSQPIAIVGMSCRAPGGLASPESYWSLLENGSDAVGPLPGRWSRALLRRLDAVTGGLAQGGGFLDAVEDFDAGFFGISPREALEMDPQQRLILEAVWEALERAGIRPDAQIGRASCRE